MGNTDKTLQDKDYLNIYPITRERNVYDENNVNLKTKFENVVFKDNDVHKFSQELYEESKNILDINQEWEAGSSSGYVEGNKLYIKTVGGNGGYVIGKKKYNVNIGEKYAISGTHQMTTGRVFFRAYDSSNKLLSTGLSGINAYLASYKGFWSNLPRVIEITSSNVAYIRIGFVAMDTDDTTVGEYYYYENLQLEKSDVVTEFHPYNPNRHITNSGAEFLKEEFGKSSNLYYGTHVLGTVVANTGLIQSQPTRVTTGEFYKVNPNTKYSITITGLQDIAYVLRDSDKNKLVDSGWNGSDSITITTTSETEYIQMVFRYSDNRTITSPSELTSVMFNEGEPLPYQPYNSASHITNAQADLLKSEWEKQANKLNEYKYLSQYCTYANGKWTTSTTRAGYSQSIFANQTGYETDRIISRLPFISKGNKTLSIYDITNSTNSNNINIALYNSSGVIIGKPISKTITTNMNFNISVENDCYLDIRVEGNTGTISFSGISVYDGFVELPYQEWNGKILHPRDIEPTILFKGSAYESITLTDNIENYDYVEFDVIVAGDWNAKTIKIKGQVYPTLSLTLDSANYVSGSQVSGLITRTTMYIVNGKTLTFNGNIRIKYDLSSSTTTADTTNEMKVIEVRGYKGV